MNRKYVCEHIIKNSDPWIESRTYRSAWFSECVACKELNIFSYEMFKCTECNNFIHKRCWERFREFSRTLIVIIKCRGRQLRENSVNPDENVDASGATGFENAAAGNKSFGNDEATQSSINTSNNVMMLNRFTSRLRKIYAETKVQSKMMLGIDPETALKKLCMIRRLDPPRYELVESGIRTIDLFEFNCRVKDYCVTGQGPSKKAAKRQAANLMCRRIKNYN